MKSAQKTTLLRVLASSASTSAISCTMKPRLPKHHSLQALASTMAAAVAASALFALTPSAHADVAVIDSITSTGDGTDDQYGTISSLTVGSTTYGNLIAPTSVSATAGGADFIWIDGTTEPTTVAAAVGGLGLDAGLLNTALTTQFGQVVTDADRFFILVNQDVPSFPNPLLNQITVQAIDSLGDSVGGTLSIGNIWTSDGSEKIVIDRNWNRTGGSTLTSRELYGIAFSLADLGLAGNTTVTGFKYVDGGASGMIDPQTIGLAVSGLVNDDYSTWATGNGIDGEPFEEDFNSDGITNGVAYGLGLSPTAFGQPAGVLSGDTITFTKGVDAIANGDVTWIIQTSETLAPGSWTNAVTQAAGDASTTISYTFTPGTPTREFARLKVMQVGP